MRCGDHGDLPSHCREIDRIIQCPAQPVTMLSVITRIVSRLAIVLCPALLSPAVAAQAPVLELDHVYILVPPGATAAIEALRGAGLTVDTRPDKHDGEGTTSIAAFFENGYLELMWVDSSVAIDSAHQEDVANFRRGTAWRETGASPFGIGLHFLAGDRSSLTIPYELDPIPGEEQGGYWILLRQPAESLATEAFIMPADRAVPAWVTTYRTRHPEFFTHASVVRRITSVIVRGPPSQRAAAAVLDLRLVRFEDADSPLLVVEFDGGSRGHTWDLRPALPLILSR